MRDTRTKSKIILFISLIFVTINDSRTIHPKLKANAFAMEVYWSTISVTKSLLHKRMKGNLHYYIKMLWGSINFYNASAHLNKENEKDLLMFLDGLPRVSFKSITIILKSDLDFSFKYFIAITVTFVAKHTFLFFLYTFLSSFSNLIHQDEKIWFTAAYKPFAYNLVLPFGLTSKNNNLFISEDIMICFSS